MALPYLITRSDFAPYVEVATNLSDSKLNPRILEAQMFDLKPLLGGAFYDDFIIVHDPVLAPYTDLLPYLKPVIVYFAAARLINSLDLHITPNGVMQKRNEFSDHVDIKGIAFKATEYRNIAIGYWGEAVEYINKQGKTIYPLYEGFATCGGNSHSGYSPRLFGIKGRNTNGYR